MFNSGGNKINIEVGADVDEAKRQLGGVAGSFTEFSSAIDIAEKALGYLQKGFDATVGKFTAYAEQVEDLSRVTGMTAEETSSLIQVADDLNVEYSSLKTAAKQLADDGFIPNIDTLAKLSDKYLSFTDDTERAQWASKEFGRNYAEMTKILEAGGDALREAAASQPEGFILSQEDLDAAKRYREQVDELKDSLESLQIEIGSKVVPALVSMLQRENENISGIKTLIQALKEGTQIGIQFRNGELQIGTQAALNAENNEKYAQALDYTARAYTAMAENINYTVSATGELIFGTDKLAESMAGAETWATNHLVTQADYAQALWTTQTHTDQLTAAMGMYNAAISGSTIGTSSYTRELNLEIDAAASAKRSIGDSLVKAYNDLRTAQQSWYNTVAGDVVAGLQSMDLNAGLTEKGLRAIDAVFGTNYLERQQYSDQIETINAEFLKTGDVAAYQTSLKKLADEFETSLAKNVDLARQKVDNLEHALTLLDGKHVTATVDVIINSIPTSGGGGGGGSGGVGGGGSGDTGGRGTGGPGGGNTSPLFRAGGGWGGIVVNNYGGEAVATNWAIIQQARRSRDAARMGG